MGSPTYGEHGQCEATAKSTGERCRRPAIGPHGKCDVHGGKSLKGEEHPNFESGAWSKYADYDDEILADVASMSENHLDVLIELRNERLAQYYTLLQYLSENEGVAVATKILDAIEDGEAVDRQLVAELARVMDVSSSSFDNLVARIQSLTNDIIEHLDDSPERFEHEHTMDDAQLAALEENLQVAFGGGDA